MDKPLVSVLMTAYNREKYIAEAIESVLASSYDNWELIIVDDQSKDRTVEIAREYQKKDSRIKVYVNEVNLGDYPNRNKAAAYAQGKYLKYVDADDLIYPHGLEVLVNMMEMFPGAGWGLLSLPQDMEGVYPILLEVSDIYRYNYFKRQIFYKAPLSSVIRSDVFRYVRGFKNVRHFGDYDLWHRLALSFPLVLMPQGLVWWRKHTEQENHKRKSNHLIQIYTLNSAIESINSPLCSLSLTEKESVLKKIKKKKRFLIINNLKNFEFINAFYKLKNFNDMYPY